ncbi:MAG: SDR family NAD(P)-dependent oxidoreductase [Syntrophobacteraceae bacterium]
MKGLWALVTGASAGMGRAIAGALAARGVNLLVNARRENRQLELKEELCGKYGVRAITDGLRMDLMGKKIRVTNIEPGMVKTEFNVLRLGDEAKAEAVYEGYKPLQPEDIAEAVIWCLERPPHVNIQELVVFPTDQVGVGPMYIHREPTS